MLKAKGLNQERITKPLNLTATGFCVSQSQAGNIAEPQVTANAFRWVEVPLSPRPREASADAGEREPRYRKVHSLIDKVYDPNNLEEAYLRGLSPKRDIGSRQKCWGIAVVRYSPNALLTKASDPWRSIRRC
jgi:hypothetical protein